jgi:hypothetical protein
MVARKHFCEDELPLSRRLEPSIHLDGVPVCATRASLHLRGHHWPIFTTSSRSVKIYVK